MEDLNDGNFLKNFGANLHKLRLAKGLSYRKMAQKCTVDHANIKRIENGEKNITLLTLTELAKALEVLPKVLLDFSCSTI